MWAIACIMGEITDGQPLFPGDDDFDQLCVIQKLIGPITPEQMKMHLTHPRFGGLQMPDVKKPKRLDVHYKGKMSEQALDFMKMILKMDPKQRLTAEQALKHPYFEGLDKIYGTNLDNRNSVPISSSRLNSAKESEIESLPNKDRASQPVPTDAKQLLKSLAFQK